jgi:hypothetical protein
LIHINHCKPLIMSEAPKPVEEPVAAPTEAPVEPAAPAAPEITTAVTAEATPAAEAPAAAAEPAKEEAAVAAPVKEEIKPVEEGILGYKGPGLLKSFIFQKKFFWFGTEAVESKALSSYLRGEKAQDIANQNVAWASETGKGLLFFSKKAAEKATPAGIFNLSEISDIVEEGNIAFHFTQGGHKHIFETNTLGERDNWVAQLKAKAAEAKELAPTVTESEQYKENLATLTKPVVTAAAHPKKSVEKTEDKKEEKKEETTTPTVVEPPKEEAKKEEKKERKSRSASRKRNSIFGGFGLGKKEDKVESPKTDVAPTAEEPVAAEADPAAETTEAAPAEPAADAAPASPTEEARPKRSSIFVTLKSQFSSHKEKKAEDAPAVPAKDAEPVSENAPVIPAVEASEPLATSVASPTVPAETTEAVPATNGETKTETTPVVKSDKRKSSLPWLNKKDKSAPTSDEETDKPKSPFAKLRATVKGKKAAEKPAESAAETSAAAEAAPAATTEAVPATAEPAVATPEPVPATSASVTASA